MKLELTAAITVILPSLTTLPWLIVPASCQTRNGSCVELAGIMSGGGLEGEDVLDLNVVNRTLAAEPFDFTFAPISAIIPTLAGCSSGLETPISMRNILGE